MIKDLRSYLDVLRANNELLQVTKEVDTVREIGAVMATLERTGGEAVYFSNVKGFDIPVTGGMLSNHKKIALALECEPEQISDRVGTALENPLPAEIVDESAGKEDVPFKENVITGADVDMTKLPIPVHAPEDGGPFITGGVTFSRALAGSIPISLMISYTFSNA